MLKFGFSLFLQESELFEPVFGTQSLADALILRLNKRSPDVASLTVVTLPGLHDRSAARLREHWSGVPPRLQTVESPVLADSARFFAVIHETIQKDPGVLAVFLEPQATGFDWEVVDAALRGLQQKDILFAYSTILQGWNVRAAGPEFIGFYDGHRNAIEGSPAPLIEAMARIPERSVKIAPSGEFAKKMWESADWEKRMGFSIHPMTLRICRELFKRTDTPPADTSVFEFGTLVSRHPELIRSVPDSIILEISTESSVIPFYSPLRHLGDRIRGRGKFMPPELFEIVLSKLDAGLHNRLKINFAGAGDPLDHPSAAALLEAMYRRFSSRQKFPGEIIYYTFGGNMTEGLSELLVQHQYPTCVINLLIRLDTDDERLYSKLRTGVPLAAVLANIRRYFEIKKRFYADRGLGMKATGPKTAVLITLVSEVLDHIDDFMKRWPAQNSFMKKYRTKTSTRKEAYALLDKFYRENNPLEYVVIVSPSHFAQQIPGSQVADYTPLKRFPCRRLNSVLTILCDGTVVPCDRVLIPDSQTSIGNIRDFGSILEAWNHPVLQRWRNDHQENRLDQLPLCRACGDWFIPVD